jgi:hypothetical protein
MNPVYNICLKCVQDHRLVSQDDHRKGILWSPALLKSMWRLNIVACPILRIEYDDFRSKMGKTNLISFDSLQSIISNGCPYATEQVVAQGL